MTLQCSGMQHMEMGKATSSASKSAAMHFKKKTDWAIFWQIIYRLPWAVCRLVEKYVNRFYNQLTN